MKTVCIIYQFTYAIVHRDYSITGAKIELEITPEKIEVRSPGEPVSPNSISDLKNFTAVSYARNSDLAYVFNLMRLMEESGVGMDTFKSLKTKYDLPLPIITYKKPNVIVTFPRTIEAVRIIGGDAIKELTNDELDGYEWIKSQGEVSAKEYASQFVIASRTASRHLAKMLELNLIKTNGKNTKSPKLRYSTR